MNQIRLFPSTIITRKEEIFFSYYFQISRLNGVHDAEAASCHKILLITDLLKATFRRGALPAPTPSGSRSVLNQSGFRDYGCSGSVSLRVHVFPCPQSDPQWIRIPND